MPNNEDLQKPQLPGNGKGKDPKRPVPIGNCQYDAAKKSRGSPLKNTISANQLAQDIFTHLQTSFSSATRLYDLSIEGLQERSPPHTTGMGFLPGQTFMVEAYCGTESLHASRTMDILVLATDAHIALPCLLGKTCTLHTALSDGSRTTTSGLINQAELLDSEGGLARYRLRVVDASWMLGQSLASRVWQDTPMLDIIASVLARYTPQLAWTLSDEVQPFMAQAHQGGLRSYCVQYRETDLAFVQRLLASEGLSWRVEEHAESPAKHRLVIFADSSQNSAFPEDYCSAHVLGGQGIRFHRGQAMQAQDSLQALGCQYTMTAAIVTLLGTDYKTKQSISASSHSRKRVGGKNAPQLEVYLPQAPYTLSNRTQAQRQTDLHMQILEARQERYFARSTVRSLHAGSRITLSQAPIPQLQDPDHPGLAVLGVQHLGINNLPKPARQGLAELLGDVPDLLSDLLHELHAEQDQAQTQAQRNTPGLPQTHAQPQPHAQGQGQGPWTAETGSITALNTAALIEQAQALGYANQCELLRADVPWRPLRTSAPRFTGTQSALVVGPSGSPSDTSAGDLYCDRLGRVRIRFHWQGQLADGDGATSGAASCWVRVAQRSAGGGMGMQFLPRVGQEVLVQFLEGDVQRPIVVGALYNGQGEGGVVPTPGGVDKARQQSQEQKNKDLNNPFAGAHDHRPSAQGNLMAGSASGAQGNSPPWFGSAHGRHGQSESTLQAGGHANAAAQWGIRTQEWGSQGYNQLLFDDSDTGGNQQRIQFKTSQYASELNLGHLIHSADNYRGSLRGQGFELRSDAYGAVRAGAGLMFSTYGLNHNASSRDPAGDNSAALALLKQATLLSRAFSEAASTHQSVKLASHEGSLKSQASAIDERAAPIAALLKASATQVSSQSLDEAYADAAAKQTAPDPAKLPHSGEATLTLAGQGGLALVAGQSLQFSNNETLSLMSGLDSQSITGGQLRIHSGQAIGFLGGAVGAGEDGKGLTLIAAQDPLRYEAQSDEIKVQAKELINIQSANSHIDFAAAKKIILSTAAGANITIEGGNITVQCPGKLTVHASVKRFDGPSSLSREMNTWPKTKFDQRYVIRHRATNEPMVNTLVEITRADGSKIKAVTDAAGKLPIQKGIGPEELFIKVLGKA